MASIISHPAIPLAIGIGLGSGIISRRLLVAGVLFSIAPDLDLYAEFIPRVGHRGITHTLLFALVCGSLAALAARALDSRALTTFSFITVATASHGFLDAFTNGGTGIIFFWPLSSERYFMPFRVIEVSPIGIASFFSQRGVEVLASELKWVWLPAILLGIVLYVTRRTHQNTAPRDPHET
jgi:inner membrane protein